MALRQIIGIDYLWNVGGVAGLNYLGTFGPYFGDTTNRGGYSRKTLNVNGSGTNIVWWGWQSPPAVTATSGYLGFACTSNPTASSANFLIMMSSTTGWDTGTYMFRLTSVGTALHIYDAAGTTSIANATGVFTKPGDTAPYYFIEVGWTISGSSSTSVTVRVDGTTVMSGVSVTLPAASNLIRSCAFTQFGYPYWLMDLYLADNTGSANNSFLGDCRAEWLPPTAEGANTGWSNVGGANKTASVSTPDATATYIRSTTVGVRETFALTDLHSTAGTIVGVEVDLQATQGSTAPSTLGATVRVAGTNYDSAGSLVLQSGFGTIPRVFDRSPATGTNWTATEVNALEAGPVILS